MLIPNTLYHYCSAQTFHSIVTNKSVRLSSLDLSNDSQEGRWAIDRLGDACIQAGLEPNLLESVKAYVTHLIGSQGGLGLCLSTKADMLSQWRGYADDGFGFCLGFNSSYLLDYLRLEATGRPLVLMPVVYAEDVQIARLRGLAHDIVGFVRAGASLDPTVQTLTEEEDPNRNSLRQKRAFEASLYKVNQSLYEMKNGAFSEEEEWRLFAPYNPDQAISVHRQYFYAANRDRIRPYLELNLRTGKNIFDVIYRGPRNITPKPVISEFLKANLDTDVLVRPSVATYR